MVTSRTDPYRSGVTNSEPTIPVLGVGNALVDVISEEHDSLIVELGLEKNAMQLIDEERMAVIYDAMGQAIETSGGSAANTMAGLASFGVQGHFIGRVRDDQLGRIFAHDIRSIGVGFTSPMRDHGPATGCCLVLVTPDAHRTMNTFLGSAALLDPLDIDADVVSAAAVTYLEGYLFDMPEAQDAFRSAAQIAHSSGRSVALTLSDLFCVERHHDAFVDLVDHHVDMLFANESEICSLVGTDDPVAAARQVSASCPLVVVTLGEHGAIVVGRDGQEARVPAEPVELVDTTGAGDQFAAGFLAGWSTGRDLETSARFGAVAAAECIGHIGPRPAASLADLVVGLS